MPKKIMMDKDGNSYQKGVTLLEVIVAMSIMFMVMGMANDFLLNTSYSAKESTEKSDAHTIALAGINYIEDNIQHCLDVKIFNGNDDIEVVEVNSIEEIEVHKDQIKMTSKSYVIRSDDEQIKMINSKNKDISLLNKAFFHPYNIFLEFKTLNVNNKVPPYRAIEIAIIIKYHNDTVYTLQHLVPVEEYASLDGNIPGNTLLITKP